MGARALAEIRRNAVASAVPPNGFSKALDPSAPCGARVLLAFGLLLIALL